MIREASCYREQIGSCWEREVRCEGLGRSEVVCEEWEGCRRG